MALMIGVISQKGGTGKSTLARLLAREYACNNWQVKLADLDVRQQTSLKWNQRRQDKGIEPALTVEGHHILSQATRSADIFDLLIFDGPPHADADSYRIAAASDLTIIPTGPAQDDLEPNVLLAHELIGKGISRDRLCFALCRLVTEAERTEALVYLAAAEYTACPVHLPERPAFRKTSNKGQALTECAWPDPRRSAEAFAQGLIDLITERTGHAD